jgi:hypothetical protein
MASFKEAFAAARKAQGAGGEFTWKGKPYSTNIAGETGRKKKLSFSTDMAEKAIDKASGVQTANASTPRPQPRPTEIAKGVDVSDGGIKVSKIDGKNSDQKKSAQYVRPEGKASGMPKKTDSESNTPGVAGASAAIGTGAAILASGLKSRSGAGGAGRASANLLPKQSTVLRLPAPQKMIGKDDPKTEAKTTPKKRSASKPVRKTISPKIAAPQASAPKSQNSRGGGKTGGGGTMMGGDPMFRALGGGGFGSLEDLGREGLMNMKRGGVVKMKEGSAKDMREDKVLAKKAGMSMKKWEKSAADKKHDAPKKMAGGGVVKKAGGGSMRGTGAAVRGKGFSGCY